MVAPALQFTPSGSENRVDGIRIGILRIALSLGDTLVKNTYMILLQMEQYPSNPLAALRPYCYLHWYAKVITLWGGMIMRNLRVIL